MGESFGREVARAGSVLNGGREDAWPRQGCGAHPGECTQPRALILSSTRSTSARSSAEERGAMVSDGFSGGGGAGCSPSPCSPRTARRRPAIQPAAIPRDGRPPRNQTAADGRGGRSGGRLDPPPRKVPKPAAGGGTTRARGRRAEIETLGRGQTGGKDQQRVDTRGRADQRSGTHPVDRGPPNRAGQQPQAENREHDLRFEPVSQIPSEQQQPRDYQSDMEEVRGAMRQPEGEGVHQRPCRRASPESAMPSASPPAAPPAASSSENWITNAPASAQISQTVGAVVSRS